MRRRYLPSGISVLLVLAAAWSAEPVRKAHGPRFQTSDRCVACHNGLTTPSGEDVSIGFDWRTTMMANSARDPYWQAGVRRETIDHPESNKAIEDECSICHMPMARFELKASGHEGQIFALLGDASGRPADPLAVDGVSCSLCHQMGKEKLGTRDSFVGGFVIDPPSAKGERLEYGPFQVDAGHARIMRTSTGGFNPVESPHIRQSEVCATCHTLYTKALGPGGKELGELAEQMPYQEWLHSEFRNGRSCQSCHMPAVKEDVPITSVLGEARSGVLRHMFLGGNFLIQRILNSQRNELGTTALPQELSAASAKTMTHLQAETARLSFGAVELRARRLEAVIRVENLAGHKLPTAYPSRRVWLHLTVRDRTGGVVFESGGWQKDGSIRGNDNDTDPSRFEPHYSEIRESGQVQIYEPIMGDSRGAVTTGLLSAVRYLKDNRLLPRGFDKRTANWDVAVAGFALEDKDFTGAGDSVRYSAEVSEDRGPFRIEAELCFQSIGFRWADNLRRYDADEPKRFMRYYREAAPASVAVLARAEAAR